MCFLLEHQPVKNRQWLVDLMTAHNLEHEFGITDTLDDLVAMYDSHPATPIRERILRLEKFLLTLPQVETPVKHFVLDGMYYREMLIPKGTVLTGAVHKDAHICIMPKGDITILSDDGLKRISEPCTFVSGALIKRAGYAHEDTVFINIQRTDESDPEIAAKTCITGEETWHSE